MINERASTGYGTVYAHFSGGKDEIFICLIEDLISEFYAIADIRFIPQTIEEAHAIIKAQVTHFLKLAEMYRDTLVIIWEGIGLSTLVQSKWKDIVRKFHERIKHDIQYSQELGMARQLPAEQVAWVLLSAVENNLWQIALGESAHTAEEIAKTIVEVYMFGLYKK